MIRPIRNIKTLPPLGFLLQITHLLEISLIFVESNKCVFLQNKLKNSYHILKPEIIDDMSGPIGRKKEKRKYMSSYLIILLAHRKSAGKNLIIFVMIL